METHVNAAQHHAKEDVICGMCNPTLYFPQCHSLQLQHRKQCCLGGLMR